MQARDHKHPKLSSSARNSTDALGSRRPPGWPHVSPLPPPPGGEGPALCPAPSLSPGQHSLLHPMMARCLTCSFWRKDLKVPLPKAPEKSSFHPNTSLHFLLPWMMHFLSWTFMMLQAGQGTSLETHWLRLRASSAEGSDSIPDQESRIPHASC